MQQLMQLMVKVLWKQLTLTCHAMAPGESIMLAAALLPAGGGSLEEEPPMMVLVRWNGTTINREELQLRYLENAIK
jgi:hypothetical protein